MSASAGTGRGRSRIGQVDRRPTGPCSPPSRTRAPRAWPPRANAPAAGDGSTAPYRVAGYPGLDSGRPGAGVAAGMPTLVMKFGGTSVGSVERLEGVAEGGGRARGAGRGGVGVLRG